MGSHFFIFADGERKGPFSHEQVVADYKSGKYRKHDTYWTEGNWGRKFIENIGSETLSKAQVSANHTAQKVLRDAAKKHLKQHADNDAQAPITDSSRSIPTRKPASESTPQEDESPDGAELSSPRRNGSSSKQSDSQGKSYYYKDNEDKETGPHDMDELRQFLELGILSPDTLVKREDETDWCKLSELS